MAHKRKSIRDAAITLLTGLTTTKANVFASRVYPLKSASLPGLLIYTVDEESEQAGDGLDRMLTLAVEGHVQAVGGAIDDTLDTIAEEVEAAIPEGTKFSGNAINSYLASTEIEFDAESKKPVGIITLNFNIEYLT